MVGGTEAGAGVGSPRCSGLAGTGFSRPASPGWGIARISPAQRSVQAGAQKANSYHLIRRPKSDPLKLALAARLRRETTLSIKQIAGRLNLGKPKGAKSNLHKWMKGPPDDALQPKLDIE